MDYLQATKPESTPSVKPPSICVCMDACELLKGKCVKEKAKMAGIYFSEVQLSQEIGLITQLPQSMRYVTLDIY